MQNIAIATPGNCSGLYPAPDPKRLLFTRFQSGSTGPRPKPPPGGVMPINAYTFDLRELELTRYTRYQYCTWWGCYPPEVHYDGDWLGGPPSPSEGAFDLLDYTDMGNTYNVALDRLNEKNRGGLDLSVDLAEAGQVGRMANVTGNAMQYARDFRKRFGPLRVPGQLWLAYQYGIKPLLGSIYGAADESLRFTLRKLERHSARASITRYHPRIRYVNANGGVDTFQMRGPVKSSTTVGTCLTSRDTDLARWTSLNPVSLAWELMPFSFVVDWAYDVGSYLRNIETGLIYDSRFVHGYVTDLTAFQGSNTYTSGMIPQDSYENTFSGKARFLRIRRTPLTSYPLPSRPQVDVNLGSSRLLSLASLLSLGFSPETLSARNRRSPRLSLSPTYRRRPHKWDEPYTWS
ncbi:TPA_asm: maturation protein [ssRNA phage SRR6960507_4]|uniref:Maturation protein n=1 Tax=ssRNA phage SRR6960507_4 TaxID=2786514 RepID=A0A8S5L4K0_9VIRU|nr:maturation protein [ssRNA phage SRR6960507_4]DAD52261.1 TPA_asm: maturation protein [ssRNA phage SRR6960507_4]